eukprot:14878820-Alexandrium_andersonii.AAC.1
MPCASCRGRAGGPRRRPERRCGRGGPRFSHFEAHRLTWRHGPANRPAQRAPPKCRRSIIRSGT